MKYSQVVDLIFRYLEIPPHIVKKVGKDLLKTDFNIRLIEKKKNNLICQVKI